MQEEKLSAPGYATPMLVGVAALAAVLVAVAAYALHEHNLSKRLAEQNSAATSALNAMRDQVSTLSKRVDDLNSQQEAAKPAPTMYRKPLVAASSRHRIEDPRWKKMQGQIDEQARQIDATRQDLGSARTELQSSIATTHDQLVSLQKKGERNYYEFDLDKSGQFTREGPVGVSLHKANTKHQYADLDMLVDDFKVSKKHVNIYEPVVFYSAESKQPVELVINSITKNHIHGYVSEPKYNGADLQAAANPAQPSTAGAVDASQGSTTAKPTAAVRQKLEPPAR